MPINDPLRMSATFCKSSAFISLPFAIGEKNVIPSMRHIENAEFVML